MLLRNSLVIIFLLLSFNFSFASDYIPFDDPVDEEVYQFLYRLEAEGVIESSLLTTRPLSRKEIIRLIMEAERNSKDRDIFIQGLVSSLKERFKDDMTDKKYIKPLEYPYLKYAYSDSKDSTLDYNNEGDIYNKGSNVRIGFDSRAEFGWLSFYCNPEFRYSENDTALKIKRGYGVIQLPYLDILVGKDSQWWGPGYHGGILLTNNAEPMTMVRLTNPEPVLLPWIFSYIGPLRCTFFVTRLEEHRIDFPEPFLWGMRLNFKPLPYIEFGVSRTVVFGGEGRPDNNFSGGWKSFIGTSEGGKLASVSGDQKAGYDIKLTLPFKFQPVQIYLDAAGEDRAGAGFRPIKWAYLTGVYLPRILGLERIALRAEYGVTTNVWYRNFIYKEGYRYKGMIIGHHMGRDSQDIFAELSYLIPERNGRFSIYYDREKHRFNSDEPGKKDEIGVKTIFGLTNNLNITVSSAFGRVENTGSISGDGRDIYIIEGMIIYNF